MICLPKQVFSNNTLRAQDGTWPGALPCASKAKILIVFVYNKLNLKLRQAWKQNTESKDLEAYAGTVEVDRMGWKQIAIG